ncbi:MAG: AMP-binding protein [Christensenellaceae bacterium]|jgi:acetyl-CoA synthetase|nr:AMP-binding protein [Christensenellaceae bacterium]
MLSDGYVQANTADYASFYASYRLSPTEDFNFGYDVVDAIAARTPDALALLHISNEGEERRFTFFDIMEQSARAANFFCRLGIKKGDKVLLIMKRSYQYWFVNVALCKIGAVMIPATGQLLSHDISYRCNASSATTVICANDPYIIQAVEGALPSCPTVRTCVLTGGSKENWLDFDAETAKESPAFPRPTGEAATCAADPMLIYFTSGTTGFPKMARHSFLYPLGHIATARYWHTNRPGGIHFTISDTGWAKAGWGKIYGQWLCETAIFAYDFDRFDPPRVLEMIQKHRITTFCAPPTMYRMMTQNDLAANYDLSSLEHCCSAGEALNPEVFSDWKRQTGQAIYEGFGQSETTCCLGTFPGMQIQLGSMGRPVPDYVIDLLDENGKPSAEGEHGEICIRTQEAVPLGLFMGYYRDELSTTRSWYDGYYHTGDVAWRDADGYFWYVGRKDDLIKSSGYRIGPFEVESALLEHEAVLEAAVTGVPDPLRGQIVKATIVLKPGYEGTDTLKKDIQEHVKRMTAPYKYPRLIDFVDSLPKTASGKIRRVELRKG